jgi:hypothetical protein
LRIFGGGQSLEQTSLRTAFPCQQGILQGNLDFLALVMHGAAWQVAQLTTLSKPYWTIEAQKEQGIFSRHQGIEIPCYGFEQRKPVSFL